MSVFTFPSTQNALLFDLLKARDEAPGGLLIIRSLYHVLLFYLSSYFTCITCFSFTCTRAFLVYLLLVTPTFRKPALNTYITTKPATNTAINQYSLTTW